ncbi:MAG TPA: prolipoprotein diacylglyceryl transferase, partial [Ilumatobacteraceae bacterium]|nr:prolipoprotein diacylglyceryl transferase [Ilumatobacteraceae bacterium]
MALLASIPSPSSGRIEIGPISLNAYGLMIALGVVAAVWLFGRRLEERHIGTRDDANAIGVWGVVAGVIGARLYHVLTDWERFEGHWFDVVKVWEGGLGIPGGMLAGVLVGTYVGHRRGIPLGPGLNAVAPALPLAQAIGRWGNYFNQELYGKPTDLPWALEIDDAHLPANGQYPSGTTFHPTFLYESLWNLGLVGLILWLDKRSRWAGGQLLAIYVLGYGVGRFWVEGLRIDEADELGGLRWNQWVALALIVGGAGYLLFTRGAPRERIYEPAPVVPNTDRDDTAALAVATAGLPVDGVDGEAGDPDDVASEREPAGDEDVAEPAVDESAGDEGIDTADADVTGDEEPTQQGAGDEAARDEVTVAEPDVGDPDADDADDEPKA